MFSQYFLLSEDDPNCLSLKMTYSGFLDICRMGKIDILEEVEQALKSVVFPLAMVLVFPTERS